METARFLLVDDDRLIVGTVGRWLREAGYTVLEAASGDETLAIVDNLKEKIDLAIIDLSMPGMSGIELADLLRSRYRIPCLFLTAYSDSHLVEEAIDRGAIGYLVKPVDSSQLLPSVEAALARARDLQNLTDTKGHLEKALAGGRQTSIAIGILMERRDLREREAFELIRKTARSQQCRIEDLAGDLVNALETINSVGKTH